MAKNKIEDVRNLLIEGMELLLDPDNENFTVEKARALADLGSAIVQSAKVEVDYLNALTRGSDKATFLEKSSFKLPESNTK